MLSSYDFMFYLLAFFCLIFSFGVVTAASPIYAALFLVLTMIDIACLFVMMNSYFIAGVQLIVYAGAVVVLFVMVVMLFNLHLEKEAFSRGKISGFFKLAVAGMLCGVLATTIWNFSSAAFVSGTPSPMNVDMTKKIAELLFSDYLFGFEIISVLILVVAVGAVTISQFKGGTHAKS